MDAMERLEEATEKAERIAAEMEQAIAEAKAAREREGGGR